ncbi:MAG: DUF3806 domain-containing protein [Actinomycetales bacterium]|nr:DUF3806 domain-containing protein [Actinomycetales bacterium]
MSIFRRRPSQDNPPPQSVPAVPSGPAAGETLELNEGETRWLAELRTMIPDAATFSLADLGTLSDNLLASWQAERGDPNNVINALGVTLGDAVVARVPGARWAVFSDADGAELAVTNAAPGNPMIFPMAAVAKRWTAGERGWFGPYVEWAAAQLGAGAGQPGASAAGQAAGAAQGVPPSAELRALVELALGHAIDSIVPEGGPLIPFTIIEKPEGRELARFAGELSQAQGHAREHVRTSGALRAVVAWDGYLTGDGRREDAVFVEGSDAGGASVVVAHRYDPTPGATAPLGTPVQVGTGAPLL